MAGFSLDRSMRLDTSSLFDCGESLIAACDNGSVSDMMMLSEETYQEVPQLENQLSSSTDPLMSGAVQKTPAKWNYRNPLVDNLYRRSGMGTYI